MKLVDGLDRLSLSDSESTVAIGSFDGVHVGHRAILAAAVEEARAAGCQAIALTFAPHPEEFLHPSSAPRLITTPDQRKRLISRSGVDLMALARFDAALAALSAEQFITSILCDKLRARAVVVGCNFRFGKGAAGDIKLLELWQQQGGFRLLSLEPVLVAGAPASSTRIRNLLNTGRIDEAEEVLGHAFLLSGAVVKGQALASRLGFPTANLAPAARQITPADGVYAVTAAVEGGKVMGGVCSIGNRPTVPGAGRAAEVHLFGWSGSLYGKQLDVRFVKYMRPEARFESLEELRSQMGRDAEEAMALLDRRPLPEPRVDDGWR